MNDGKPNARCRMGGRAADEGTESFGEAAASEVAPWHSAAKGIVGPLGPAAEMTWGVAAAGVSALNPAPPSPDRRAPFAAAFACVSREGEALNSTHNND